jgi:hypothetical protein
LHQHQELAVKLDYLGNQAKNNLWKMIQLIQPDYQIAQKTNILLQYSVKLATTLELGL